MPQVRAVLRLPLERCCPVFRNPIWFSSGHCVCSGCGSEFMSWLRESWLTIVNWEPRATVIACGQTALFMMTSVLAALLGVHGPDGDVLDPPPPQAKTPASAAATPKPD